MKEVILFEGSTNKGDRTTSSKLYTLKHESRPDLNRKIKLSYECYNCGETFVGELFDGSKFNPIFDMSDLGITKEAKYYSPITELKPRIDMLFKEGIKYFKLLYS
jgi:hypothetical protein